MMFREISPFQASTSQAHSCAALRESKFATILKIVTEIFQNKRKQEENDELTWHVSGLKSSGSRTL